MILKVSTVLSETDACVIALLHWFLYIGYVRKIKCLVSGAKSHLKILYHLQTMQMLNFFYSALRLLFHRTRSLSTYQVRYQASLLHHKSHAYGAGKVMQMQKCIRKMCFEFITLNSANYLQWIVCICMFWSFGGMFFPVSLCCLLHSKTNRIVHTLVKPIFAPMCPLP